MTWITIDNVQRAVTPKAGNSELWFLCSANSIMVIYICIKFRENISNSFQVTEWAQIYFRSRVCVGEGYSEEFEVKVSVYQSSVFSPLLFIIMLEALLHEFRSGVPWEDLYADDLVIITESLKECVRRLLTLKEAMEEKGQSKCRKDKDHDLWYEPGPAEFRQVSMCQL